MLPFSDELWAKKPVPVEEQVATDKQGRRRFHGAFTGGFSAGYFNTVGSEEGWTPATFRSTRAEKEAKRQQRPEDFMVDEVRPFLQKSLSLLTLSIHRTRRCSASLRRCSGHARSTRRPRSPDTAPRRSRASCGPSGTRSESCCSGAWAGALVRASDRDRRLPRSAADARYAPFVRQFQHSCSKLTWRH